MQLQVDHPIQERLTPGEIARIVVITSQYFDDLDDQQVVVDHNRIMFKDEQCATFNPDFNGVTVHLTFGWHKSGYSDDRTEETFRFDYAMYATVKEALQFGGLKNHKDKEKFHRKLLKPHLSENAYKEFGKSAIPLNPVDSSLKEIDVAVGMSQLVLWMLAYETIFNRTSEELHVLFGCRDKKKGWDQAWSADGWLEHVFEEYESRLMSMG